MDKWTTLDWLRRDMTQYGASYAFYSLRCRKYAVTRALWLMWVAHRMNVNSRKPS